MTWYFNSAVTGPICVNCVNTHAVLPPETSMQSSLGDFPGASVCKHNLQGAENEHEHEFIVFVSVYLHKANVYWLKEKQHLINSGTNADNRNFSMCVLFIEQLFGRSVMRNQLLVCSMLLIFHFFELWNWQTLMKYQQKVHAHSDQLLK